MAASLARAPSQLDLRLPLDVLRAPVSGSRPTVRSLLVFFGLLVSLCGLRPGAAHAETSQFPFRGGMYAGGMYGSATGDEADFDSFQYLDLGVWVDHAWFHAGIETPTPFLLVDALVGAFAFIGGEDIGVPLLGALNGDQDPGRIRLFQLDGTFRFFRAGIHGIEAGLLFDFSLLSAYGPGRTDEGERMREGDSSANLGATLGYALSTDTVLLRARMTAGNGFTDEHDINPFIGFGVLADVVLAKPFAMHLSYDLIGQHLDLREEDPYADSPRDIHEWVAFGTTVVALGGAF